MTALDHLARTIEFPPEELLNFDPCVNSVHWHLDVSTYSTFSASFDQKFTKFGDFQQKSGRRDSFKNHVLLSYRINETKQTLKD